MRYFKIEKFYRGGSKVYYAKMSNRLKMKKNYWQHQLEKWGENTESGENYGYRICFVRIQKLPKTKIDKWNTLNFNQEYLEKK